MRFKVHWWRLKKKCFFIGSKPEINTWMFFIWKGLNKKWKISGSGTRVLTILTRKKPSSKRDPTLYRVLLLWYITNSAFEAQLELRPGYMTDSVIYKGKYYLYYLNALFNFPVPSFLLHSCQFKPSFILNLLLIRLNLNVHAPESRKFD